MIGRGLRGPAMGGSKDCLLIDVRTIYQAGVVLVICTQLLVIYGNSMNSNTTKNDYLNIEESLKFVTKLLAEFLDNNFIVENKWEIHIESSFKYNSYKIKNANKKYIILTCHHL